ncbi:radical SAM protein [Caldisalinibacter kiritimatiensis]|uniref:Fe-S oxidoreductase n=1 Tax=Caldisalinibacter kiritimatiensis TaxID=1304284 RepID=R1ATH1_9FIRM|nr:radical SAM protein [Caldisalinibacter kiritimatiensis]EOC99926.1 Fe-S oxidoreductase [Caldisalinibacter kiritimatiensis]
MKSAKQLVSSMVLNEGLKYIEKNPMNNLTKILDWGDKLATENDHKNAIKTFRRICSNPDNNWYKLIERFFTELNPNARKKFITNFFVNSGLVGVPLKKKQQKKYDCNIPWAILMDPTSACNLQCTGCWAAEYDKVASLSNSVLDRIIKEGKELGIYMYIFSGGEPLVRKEDLIKLAEKHDDCMFLAFTNGTLVDEKFAKDLARVGNFALAISVEGFEEETDMRRGEGTYQRVMKSMDLLKKEGVIFGFSTCYHRYNTEVIGSDEYVDYLIEKGCTFGWYFTYIPIGKDAVIDLLARPNQREYMYRRVREMRQEKPIFVLDFWNDGEYVNGCIAGGRNYLHINSNGDVEPCAFIHYSNVNIKEVSLLEALKSPLFEQYRLNQPFNANHLRPCPLLDNPNKLKEMVHKSKAKSTQPIDKESVDDLTNKCQEISKKWAVTAEKLWKESKNINKSKMA